MGLNGTYIQVRSNIFMMKPLPSISIVYGILLADEKQRHLSSTSHLSTNSSSFHARTSKQQYYPPKVNFDPHKSSLYYKCCKRSLHVMEKCHRLHDYPSNFKFTKNVPHTKTVAHVELENLSSHDISILDTGLNYNIGANNNISESQPHMIPYHSNFSLQAPIPDLSMEQSCQLIFLLQRSQMTDSPSNQPASHLMASANFAGPFTEEASGSW
ncbi:uncharacterized protein LOC132637829 [Lycium barbarum]|uniref:uncharacterized protein LOC132637829 n=1 Tax=Lycium barbarum TaxID=112863 RepID=UPI00293F356D|nr:uncharacterized protein LOC132637829 [Lycium barbarum]